MIKIKVNLDEFYLDRPLKKRYNEIQFYNCQWRGRGVLRISNFQRAVGGCEAAVEISPTGLGVLA